MLPVVLVYEDQADLVIKGPLQQWIVLSLHQYEEEREVRLVARSISIEIGSYTHLVAISEGEGESSRESQQVRSLHDIVLHMVMQHEYIVTHGCHTRIAHTHTHH